MYFRIGEIPSTVDFVADESWQPLREPSPWLGQIMAAPLGIAASTIVCLLWFVLTPLKIETLASPLWLMLAVFLVIPIHELIHAAFHPGYGMSNRTVLGFWPEKLMFYAHYHGSFTRNRFIAILIAPFLTISFIPLIVASLLGMSHPFFAMASIVNALAACLDLLGVCLLVIQVPTIAVVQNQGWRTFWRTQRDSVPNK